MKSPILAEDISTVIESIKSFVAFGTMVTPDLPVKHHFSDNIYCREIFMPAGSVVVGKKHATRHLNIVLSGECEIWTVQEHIHCKPGMIFETMAGVQKVVKMLTDVKFLTVHFNPDNLREQDALEGKYIQTAEQLPLFPELDALPLVQEQRRLT